VVLPLEVLVVITDRLLRNVAGFFPKETVVFLVFFSNNEAPSLKGLANFGCLRSMAAFMASGPLVRGVAPFFFLLVVSFVLSQT